MIFSTEAEFVAAVEVVQNMLVAWRVVESMGLKVKLPMSIEVDDKGAVDLANSWTATNRTRHIATRINFLRELKGEGVISVQWISSFLMSSDIFTKNVSGQDFKRHRDVYVRKNPSVPYDRGHGNAFSVPAGEGVGAGVGVGRSVTEKDRSDHIGDGISGSRKRKTLN
jgi:hypothetical protein